MSYHIPPDHGQSAPSSAKGQPQIDTTLDQPAAATTAEKLVYCPTATGGVELMLQSVDERVPSRILCPSDADDVLLAASHLSANPIYMEHEAKAVWSKWLDQAPGLPGSPSCRDAIWRHAVGLPHTQAFVEPAFYIGRTPIADGHDLFCQLEYKDDETTTTIVTLDPRRCDHRMIAASRLKFDKDLILVDDDGAFNWWCCWVEQSAHRLTQAWGKNIRNLIWQGVLNEGVSPEAYANARKEVVITEPVFTSFPRKLYDHECRVKLFDDAGVQADSTQDLAATAAKYSAGAHLVQAQGPVEAKPSKFEAGLAKVSLDAMSIKDLINCGELTPQLAAERLADHPALSNSDPDDDESYRQAVVSMVADELTEHTDSLRSMQRIIHGLNRHAGWWTDLETGEDVLNWPKKFQILWVMSKLLLIVTEVAEATEGHRKNLMDDKLPHRPMLEVELADAVIRAFDLAGGLGLDLAGAMIEKLAFNSVREDHTREHRAGENGKKY